MYRMYPFYLWTVTILCINYPHTNRVKYPYGTYVAKVSTGPFMPKQKITVVTKERNKASIQLRGLVNFEDTFWYGWHEDRWESKFSDTLNHKLRKYRCVLKKFNYDPCWNVATVNLNVPILGDKKINLMYEI